MQVKQHKSDVALTASNETLCNSLNLCFPNSKKAVFLPLSYHSSQSACFVTLLDTEFLQAQIYRSYYLPNPLRAVSACLHHALKRFLRGRLVVPEVSKQKTAVRANNTKRFLFII